jgi:hypothetical protein
MECRCRGRHSWRCPDFPNSILRRPQGTRKPVDEPRRSALSRSLRNERRWDVLNRFASALRATRMRGFMFREMFGLLESLAALLATILISRHGTFPYESPNAPADALRPCRPVHSNRILKREKIAAYGMGRRRQTMANLVLRPSQGVLGTACVAPRCSASNAVRQADGATRSLAKQEVGFLRPEFGKPNHQGQRAVVDPTRTLESRRSSRTTNQVMRRPQRAREIRPTAPLYHSIKTPPRSSIDCGIVRPSAFAVFGLINSSNSVGCATGSSAGFCPLSILST